MKADLREQIGRAVNASNLRMAANEPGLETALQRVAALGMATLAVHLGTDRSDSPVAEGRDRVPAREDVVAGDLSALLWRVRYGNQVDLVPQTIALFAEWMSGRGAMKAIDPLRIERFAAAAMDEWLSDRCTACGGSGKLERSRTGGWIRPRGSMQRNATYRACLACHGCGRRSPRPPERMRRLGLTREEYDAQHWPQRFGLARTWLNTILPTRIARQLTSELERRKRRE